MASDAGFGEIMDLDAWPDDSGEGMYQNPSFTDATLHETDPSVLVDEWRHIYSEEGEDDMQDVDSSVNTFNAAAYFGDKELVQGHSMAAELRQGEKFNQKIPPTYDGQMSYFAYEKLVIESCSITTVDKDKRAPLLLHAFSHHALIHEEFIAMSSISDETVHSELTPGLTNGCHYLLEYIRKQTIKDSNSVYLMRLTQFDKLKKAHLDYKDWILRFRLSLIRVVDAWMDLFDQKDLRDMDPFVPEVFERRWKIKMAWKTFRHLEDPTDPLLARWETEKRIHFNTILGRTLDATDYNEDTYRNYRYPDSPSRNQCIDALQEWEEAMHRRAFPYTDMALAHRFILRSGMSKNELLTFQQRMQTRGISIRQYTLQIVYDVVHETFVLPMSNLDDPRYQPMGGSRGRGRREGGTFHVMKECYMKSSRFPGTYVCGYWCEEQETLDHGFLEHDPDDQGNYAFQVWNCAE